VQRVDLGPALALLLEANPQREIEQRAKAILERGIALDLARRMSRMTRPSRVRRNLSSRRARLNWWACV
jgi:hypothetical protein